LIWGFFLGGVFWDHVIDKTQGETKMIFPIMI